jgi:hypothetical protein
MMLLEDMCVFGSGPSTGTRAAIKDSAIATSWVQGVPMPLCEDGISTVLETG